MTAVGISYESYSEARSHYKTMLDAAERGLPATVERDGAVSALVDAERLRDGLGQWCPKATVVNEAGGWSVFLPGVPVAADGSTFDESITEMVDALREYADDWQTHLLDAPNHRSNWALVQLVALSTDEQLRAWLVGSAA